MIAPTSSTGGISSLDRRDRRLLLGCFAMVALAALVVAALAPQQDETDTTPSSFSSGTHGAEAAFLALQRSGYHIERWERPLDDLIPQADAHTVVIFAEPNFTRAMGAKNTIQRILDRGGRVLVTGISGAMLLGENQARQTPSLVDDLQPGCVAQPEGFDSFANSGVINVRGLYEWNTPRPDQHVQYTCRGNAVVVSYRSGKGLVVWWSDSQPLENSSIAKDGDLALLLASLGSADNRIVWDESLHGHETSLWSYANGTPVHLLWLQLTLVALLLVLSFSRRSGPLLADPIVARDMPLEFVFSLGTLYDKAGATNTAVGIAYDRFRWMLGRRARPGNPRSSEQAQAEMVSIATARLGHADPELSSTIAACEELTYESRQVKPKQALTLVLSLNKFEQELTTSRTQPTSASEGDSRRDSAERYK